ncbi:MAG: glycosyltransferase family 2 protein [Pseudomonadota bacterium]
MVLASEQVDGSALGAADARTIAPRLSIIIPTLDERANIAPLVARLGEVLGDLSWEIIFVDDDSPDGTCEEVNRVAQSEPRVRCLRRVGRRGLSSAVIEGMLVANASVIAVMDADFQHDESKLPEMYRLLTDQRADVVVATRYGAGGSVGEWEQGRARMSALANGLARALVSHQTTDPVSGFFMLDRRVLTEALYDLSQQGYKILIDILTSSRRPLNVLEVPYVFRDRREGESKLSLLVIAEFGFLLVDKLTRGLIPPRFVLFSAVGSLGLVVHLIALRALLGGGAEFVLAQTGATYIAMVSNFLINNVFTYGDRRLRGFSMIKGLALFMIICSVGAIANVSVAELAMRSTQSWSLAGIAGALMGAVFNFGAASAIVWNRKRAS